MADTTVVYGKGSMCIPLTGAVAHTGGEVCNVLNPEGEDLIITRAVVYSTHASTGACNLDVGVGTTAEHNQTELVSALDIVALTALTAKNGFACGDAADALVIWDADEYVTACGTGDSSGFTGYLFLEYLHTGTV
jgi:hypothetical protein